MSVGEVLENVALDPIAVEISVKFQRGIIDFDEFEFYFGR